MKVNLFFLMLVTFGCHADVYQCLNQNHQIEFRDKPCEANSIETRLNIYERELDLVEQPRIVVSADIKSAEQQKADKKKAIAEYKKIEIRQKAERKALRLKKREEKLAFQEIRKKEKQIKKQKKIADKIQKIENQLRLGTKLKNQSQLHAELEKRKKICQNHS